MKIVNDILKSEPFNSEIKSSKNRRKVSEIWKGSPKLEKCTIILQPWKSFALIEIRKRSELNGPWGGVSSKT